MKSPLGKTMTPGRPIMHTAPTQALHRCRSTQWHGPSDVAQARSWLQPQMMHLRLMLGLMADTPAAER